jgi:ribonucleoside-triphosphate reductase
MEVIIMELTDLKVKKRDDSYVEFDKSKISNAIYKAVLASHDNKEQLDRSIADTLANMVCTCIYDKINDPELDVSSCDINISIPVETIQDIVERVLIKNGYADTAKAYILYRNKRNEIRNTRDSISKTISDILIKDSKDCDAKRENGNIDGNTAMGTMLQIGANVSKNYYLNNMMSKDIAKAHIDGYIHIHDLDFYKLTVTCCQIDFKKLAKGGFNPGHGFVREPQSIGSCATLAAIAIQSDQGDCHSFCGSIQK